MIIQKAYEYIFYFILFYFFFQYKASPPHLKHTQFSTMKMNIPGWSHSTPWALEALAIVIFFVSMFDTKVFLTSLAGKRN